MKLQLIGAACYYGTLRTDPDGRGWAARRQIGAVVVESLRV